MADAVAKKITYVRVDKLHLDPANPRLPSTIDRSDQGAVLRWMLEDATLVELMQSIGAQGFFEGEPLLVEGGEGDDVDLTVVEGNRRLAAVTLLRDPDRAPGRRVAVRTVAEGARVKPPEVLPVIRFTDRGDVLDYLGYRHVTGIQAWDSLAKARYVKLLVDKANKAGDSDPMPEIVKKLGSRMDYLRGLMAGLEVFDNVVANDFYQLKGVDESSIKFAVLTTALSYDTIARFIGMEGRNTLGPNLKGEQVRELIDWMFRPMPPDNSTRVGESRELKKLAAVVDRKAALDALRDGASLEDARFLTDEPHEQFVALLNQAKQRLRSAGAQIHRINEPARADVDLANEIAVIAGDLRTVLTKRLSQLPQDERP